MAKPQRRQQRRGRRQRRLWIAGGVVAAAVAVALLGYLAFPGFFGALLASATPPGTSMPDQGHLHVASAADPHVPYNSDPPSSGPHLPYIAPWGIHTRPIPRELQVHNLEDGGVLVQYNCECPELVAKLRAIVEKYPKHVILAPYPTMARKIALTAWTRIETLDDFDEKRIKRFIEAYRGIDHHER